MTDFVLGLMLGLLVGGVAGLSLGFPGFGRSVARIISVLLLGLGAATLVWPLAVGASGEPLRGPFGSNVIQYRSEAFAWAAGLLTAGLLAGR